MNTKVRVCVWELEWHNDEQGTMVLYQYKAPWNIFSSILLLKIINKLSTKMTLKEHKSWRRVRTWRVVSICRYIKSWEQEIVMKINKYEKGKIEHVMHDVMQLNQRRWNTK